MAPRSTSRRTRPVAALRRQVAQAPALPFADLLDTRQVQPALRDENLRFRDRLVAPLLTLGVFLSHVLDPDPSCRQAVARLVAYRAAKGLPACSSDTDAYCKARRRLPEGLRARRAHATGQQVQDQAPPG